MKGLIFTALFDMVEEKWGEELLDQIMEDVESDTDGAYTAVGNYPFEELAAYVDALSKRLDLPFHTCAEAFGQWALPVLLSKVPIQHHQFRNTWDLIHAVDGVIHVQVNKLYPDAELPRFNIEAEDEQRLHFVYSSSRPLAHFAHGLLKGAVDHFQDDLDISLDSVNADCTQARFLVQRPG